MIYDLLQQWVLNWGGEWGTYYSNYGGAMGA